MVAFLTFCAFFLTKNVKCLFTVPLIACEIIKFSLQNGVCPDSAISFATFALFKIRFFEDYSGGKYWSDVARTIIKSNPNKNKDSEVRTELLLVRS